MEEEAPEGAPAWMATFADLMSLLLTFFVLLLSFATVDVMKFEGMIGSLRGAFGVKTIAPGRHVALDDSLVTMFDRETVSDELIEKIDDAVAGALRKLVQRQQVAGSVHIMTGKDGVVVRIEGDLLFAPGQHKVSPAAFLFLDEMAAVLRAWDAASSIEGHSDSTRGTEGGPTNLELSALRAISVLEYLAAAGGLERAMLRAIAYGDTRPLEGTVAADGRNRRVEIVVNPQARRAKKQSASSAAGAPVHLTPLDRGAVTR